MSKYIIGIDVGGTNLKVAVFSSRYKMIHKEILGTQRFARREDLIQALVDSVERAIAHTKLKKKDVAGVGIGLPGLIDEKTGLVHFLPNIPGWKEVPLKRILEKKLRVPVELDNDAKLMALAEYRLGSARGFTNVLCVTLGTGVGGGTILNGSFYRGRDNAAGEIGHVPINEKGPVCNCGGQACLEAYIGNNRIVRKAARIFKRRISLEELSAKAEKKDRRATKIWAEVGEQLGVALSGAVNLLNLDVVVIGGGVANAGLILFSRVRNTILARSMKVQGKRVKIVHAALGNDAGLIGAAVLVEEAGNKVK